MVCVCVIRAEALTAEVLVMCQYLSSPWPNSLLLFANLTPSLAPCDTTADHRPVQLFMVVVTLRKNKVYRTQSVVLL